MQIHPKALIEVARRIEPDGKEDIDLVAVEAPLQIRVDDKIFASTMRTPGDDHALVLGLLLAEGFIESLDDVLEIAPCAQNDDDAIDVRLRKTRQTISRRRIAANSACGVCGIEEIKKSIKTVTATPIQGSAIIECAKRLSEAQPLFNATGAVHGAALFDSARSMLVSAEDVGRHNAVDKVIGMALDAQTLTQGAALIVSSRASFEIVQKCAHANIPALGCVSGATSLAIEVANEAGMSLYGFVRNGKAKRYQPLS